MPAPAPEDSDPNATLSQAALSPTASGDGSGSLSEDALSEDTLEAWVPESATPPFAPAPSTAQSTRDGEVLATIDADLAAEFVTQPCAPLTDREGENAEATSDRGRSTPEMEEDACKAASTEPEHLQESDREDADPDCISQPKTKHPKAEEGFIPTGPAWTGQPLPIAAEAGLPQVSLQRETDGDRVILNLPPDRDAVADKQGLAWTDLWQQLMHQLHSHDRFWSPGAIVCIDARGRSLDARQLNTLADTLNEVQLNVQFVQTDCKTTAAMAIDGSYRTEYEPRRDRQAEPLLKREPTDDVLYLHKSIRSGVEIRYPGSVAIRGDINPGGSVVADGDILVWGRLRGIVHAGARGNRQSHVMALRLEATQVRIANRAARVPKVETEDWVPEVAYIAPQGIRICPASEFAKHQSPAIDRPKPTSKTATPTNPKRLKFP